MIGRRRSLGAGFVLFGLGMLELLVPGLLPVPASDGVLVIFGLVVLVYAYFSIQARRENALNLRETPDVELPVPTTVPGERIDTVLERFPEIDTVDTTSLSSIRSGLRRAVVTVLTRDAGYSETEATEAVESGTWTDDPEVSNFLASSQSGSGRVTDRAQREQLIDRSIDTAVAVSNVSDSAGEESADRIPDDVERTAIDPERSTPGQRRETNHWTGVGFVVLICLGVGTLTRNPGVLLGAVVGIGFAAYARSTSVGAVDIATDRTVSETEPEPGADVTVSLQVTNHGSQLLPDIRLVDGVPEALAVSDGSPRCGTALRGGESITLSYTVTARRGTHEFGPTLALVRNRSGSVERELSLSESTTITCRPSVQPLQTSVPLRSQVTQYTGQVDSETGGTGVAFRSVREYQSGDPLTRIDWKRKARTGEFTTLQFHEQRAATVVILVDSRASAYIGPEPTSQTAVETAVSGAERAFVRLLDDGNQVGIRVIGHGDRWLPPGTGSSHRHEGMELLGSVQLVATDHSPDSGEPPLWSHTVGRRLPETAQLLAFTPLCDSKTLHQLRQFEARGHPVTIISPDPTAGTTPAQRLVRVRRATIITDIRQSGIPVFDWEWNQPLETAVANGERSQ